MTLEELRRHIAGVVDYNWNSEFQDALENGLEGHVMNHLIALAEFIGQPIHPENLAELRGEEQS